MQMNPTLENNTLIIRKDGKVYKAIMKNNNRWKLYEVKDYEQISKGTETNVFSMPYKKL